MKTTTDYTLFCENIINGENSKLTLVNTFEDVYTDKFPIVLPSIMVISVVKVTSPKLNEVLTFTLTITDPKGKKLADNEIQEFKVPIESEFGINLIVNAGPMPLQQHGKYNFSFSLNGKVISSRDLRVLPESSRMKVS